MARPLYDLADFHGSRTTLRRVSEPTVFRGPPVWVVAPGPPRPLGACAGGLQLPSGPHAVALMFLWDKGVMLDLGTLGGLHSIAYSVNSSAQVVGIALNALDQSRPFVWEDGQMFDLNDLITPAPDTVLVSAYHINNRGCISGVATVRGITRGFLLTPDR